MTHTSTRESNMPTGYRMVEHRFSQAPLWRVASPYFDDARDQWIDRFVSRDQHRFELIGRVGEQLQWHEKKKARSSLGEWQNYGRQAALTLEAPSDGLISVFPQVTATLAGLARIRRDDRPILSWFFNTSLESRARKMAARASLSRVDRFVVHSTVEVGAYAQLLGIDEDRFRFVPLQYGGVVETEPPDLESPDEPFIFATGSGFRDYRTFFAAVEKLGYRTLVLAGPRVLADLKIPANVEIIDSMPKQQIRRHVRAARVNVVPMTTEGLTAGIVTLVETFRHGRGVVATRRSGLEDYLVDESTCLLYQPGNVSELAEQIEAYWSDDLLRRRIDDGASTFASTNCTDEAAASSLTHILDELIAPPSAIRKVA